MGAERLNLQSSTIRHWPATLELGFRQGPGRTEMATMRFHGPLRVQKPFYPEGRVCHVYLLHPPGGLVSGDDLRITVNGEPGSHFLVTTPSAGKIYRADSQGGSQRQQVTITAADSDCEWLPMETIVFDGAHGYLDTNIQLHGTARFIGMDIFCLGRPKSGQPFICGSIEQKIALYRDNRPLYLKRQRLDSDDPLLAACSGYRGHLVSGTLIASGLNEPEKVVAMLREQLPVAVPGTLSVIERLGVLIIRYLGDCSEEAHQQLKFCWALLRPALFNRPACVPRIWNT